MDHLDPTQAQPANRHSHMPIAIVSVPSTTELLSSSPPSSSDHLKPPPSTPSTSTQTEAETQAHSLSALPLMRPNEPNAMVACANGQVRRMRSVLDMRLGALVAAGMPMAEEGHVSPSPMRRIRSCTSDDHLSNENSSSSSSSSSSQVPHQEAAVIDSPHSLLSPDDTAWLVAQIGQLKIEQGNEFDDSPPRIKLAAVKQSDDDEEEEDGQQVDVFGIPIPSSSPCSSCVSLSTSLSRSVHALKDLDVKEKERRHFDDITGGGLSPLDELLQSTSSQVSHSISDPSCSVVLADSPSRLDLSALLC